MRTSESISCRVITFAFLAMTLSACAGSTALTPSCGTIAVKMWTEEIAAIEGDVHAMADLGQKAEAQSDCKEAGRKKFHEPDLVMAYMWDRLAAQQGDTSARLAADRLSGKMTSHQIYEVEKDLVVQMARNKGPQ